MVLDKAGLLKKLELKTDKITIDGDTVRLTEISAADYMSIYNSDAVKDDKGEWDGTKFTAALACRCIIDEAGTRVFGDDDGALLSGGSTPVYKQIAEAVNRVNGMGGSAKN